MSECHFQKKASSPFFKELLGRRPAYARPLGEAWLGDSRRLLRRVPDDVRFDLIFTSPPYALLKAKDYGNEPGASLRSVVPSIRKAPPSCTQAGRKPGTEYWGSLETWTPYTIPISIPTANGIMCPHLAAARTLLCFFLHRNFTGLILRDSLAQFSGSMLSAFGSRMP